MSFEEAIALAKTDPCIRFAAFLKAPGLQILGGGRGPKMDAAAAAYADFLRELAAGKKTEVQLRALLLDAEDKLKGVLE